MTPRIARSTRVATAGAMPMIDLMPAGEVERRARIGLMERWGWATVAALVVAALASAGTWYLQLVADQRLAEQTAVTQSLVEELATLTDVSTAVATRAELTDFRAGAMASDIDWARFVAGIRGAATDGVTVVGFDLFPGGVPQGADPAAEVGLTGQVVYASSVPVDFAPTVRDLRTLPGVMDADAVGLETVGDGESQVFLYSASLTFDQSLYTGEYAKETGAEG